MSLDSKLNVWWYLQCRHLILVCLWPYCSHKAHQVCRFLPLFWGVTWCPPCADGSVCCLSRHLILVCVTLCGPKTHQVCRFLVPKLVLMLQFTDFKAYCVGVSKCRTLPVYPVHTVTRRAILILPRMWLGQYEYCPAALAPCALPYKLCPELCQCTYKHIRWVFLAGSVD